MWDMYLCERRVRGEREREREGERGERGYTLSAGESRRVSPSASYLLWLQAREIFWVNLSMG